MQKVEDSEKRIVKILCLKDSNKLIELLSETLKVYHNYLSKNLSFPFEATYSYETGFLKTVYRDIKVTDLLNMNEYDDLEFYGLFCKGKSRFQKARLYCDRLLDKKN